MSGQKGSKDALFSILSEDQAIGGLIDARVFPTRAPMGTPLPYAIYNRITEQTEPLLVGAAELTRDTFQLDVWAATPAEAEALKQTIKNRLSSNTCGTYGGVYVDSLIVSTTRDIDEDANEGRELPIFGCSIDLILWHQAT